jgi:2-polyprenyl-3-methyl-5-hydroxy-6-metoxy-1,4-benzoquinol methylase
VDEEGYVHLQTIPYRGHHLLLDAVLRVAPLGGTVFEGGVSSGYFAQLLGDAGLVVDGHELDPLAGERARRVCRQVWTGDLNEFETDELSDTYDVLLFGDTLEHLVDPIAVLRNLRKRLRPTGALVISVPNIANWAIRLSLLAGRFEPTDRGILDRTHLHFYTRRGLVAMLEASGFTTERVVGAIPVPGVSTPQAAAITHRVGNLLPTVFAYTFIVTARPIAP